MHLLVLSAFRLMLSVVVSVFTVASQCTFWCSVLSDPLEKEIRGRTFVSQCTFWCSVLSDAIHVRTHDPLTFVSQCTFWCSVLSDPQ